MSDTPTVPITRVDPGRLAAARELVAALVPDDVSGAAPDEDLRDLGLDSIRLLGLVEHLRARGADVETVDLAVEPTLGRIAALLP